ncbi:MAG: 3-beta hydroxysteroid dehydrogenase, partial [Cyanobacteria bacterium P01_H01_bin.121]
QLGHIEDLAAAMVAALGNSKAIEQIYNISGDRYVSFDGLARACAQAAGKDPQTLQLVHYEPKVFDFGKQKAFPIRLQHFFASIEKACHELNWKPRFDLISGLRTSFEQDYGASGRAQADLDFKLDDQILRV